MTTFSHFAQRAIAGFGAVAITVSLLVASFATAPQTLAVSGMLA